MAVDTWRHGGRWHLKSLPPFRRLRSKGELFVAMDMSHGEYEQTHLPAENFFIKTFLRALPFYFGSRAPLVQLCELMQNSIQTSSPTRCVSLELHFRQCEISRERMKVRTDHAASPWHSVSERMEWEALGEPTFTTATRRTDGRTEEAAIVPLAPFRLRPPDFIPNHPNVKSAAAIAAASAFGKLGRIVRNSASERERSRSGS